MLCPALPCFAQELQPQRWRHLPIDTNFVNITYIHNDSDISFDPALRIENTTMSLDTWPLGYTRTLEMFDKTALVQIIQPWQDGDWSGTVDGQAVAISRGGFAYSITPWLGLKLQYVRSDRQVDVGNDSDRYIMSLSTFW